LLSLLLLRGTHVPTETSRSGQRWWNRMCPTTSPMFFSFRLVEFANTDIDFNDVEHIRQDSCCLRHIRVSDIITHPKFLYRAVFFLNLRPRRLIHALVLFIAHTIASFAWLSYLEILLSSRVWHDKLPHNFRHGLTRTVSNSIRTDAHRVFHQRFVRDSLFFTVALFDCFRPMSLRW
jgi:hypothetical protein